MHRRLLCAAHNRSVSGSAGRGAARRLLTALVGLLLVLSGLQVVTMTPAAADPTGTGGQFVPVQSRLVDTRTGVGGFTGPVPANTGVSFLVNGQAGLPTTGVAAVAATVTVINTAAGSQGGYLYAGANTGGSTGQAYSVLFESGDTVSNTTIIENGDDGKIKINSSQSVQVLIDIQGYFTSGNGTPAPGGFVSVSPATVSTITSPSASSTSTVQVTGLAGIPSTATAIYANLTVDNTSGSDSWLIPFAAGTNPPSVSLNYDQTSKTAIGTTVDLNAQGRMSIKFNVSVPSSVRIDVLGYFDGQPSNAGFTPVAGRVFDSTPNLGANVAAGTTVDVQVNGVAGLPVYSSSISGVALNVQTVATSGVAGSVTVWPSDQSMPAVSTVTNDGASQQSNMAIIRPGSDGKVKVRYDAPSGSARVVLDTQGYFTNTNVVGPASGTNTAASGSRSSRQPASRTLNDRTSAEINPTNGNLLLTQQLLSITGVGPSVGVNVRYNSLNDNRPTLNLGLFESQLYRNSDNTMTYTDAKGTAFTYVPNGDGTYNVPNDINAHLTRIANGATDVVIGVGATYELVFHPAQIKNVYVSDGNNLRLTETKDITGSNKITYTYGGGRLTSLTDTQGRTVTFTYSSSPNPTQPTTITDTSLNRTITLAYGGPNGALSQVTDATGQNTTWAYNAAGKVSSITDGSGRRTDFTYDSALRAYQQTFGANNTSVSGTWTVAYPSSTTTTVTDPNSHAITYTYNATKQVESVKDALLHSTLSGFNPHGDLLKTTNAATNFTTYTVESASFTYNLTKVTSPTGGAGGTGAAGRAMEAIYPTTITGNGATTDYRPQSLKDSQGNLTNLQYNSWGQTAKEDRGWDAITSTAVGGTWTYKYQGGSGTTAATCGGKNGQICSVTDGKGNVTSFAYNTAGNLSTMTPPAPLGASSYTYDAAGRRITALDGNGVTTYTCYDANDRTIQVSTTSSACGTASGVRTTYDQSGNATTINNTTNSTVATITWDAQNRPTNRTYTISGTTQTNLASSATYDRAGNVLTASDGGTGASNTTTYTYDAANNLATLAEPGGSCPATPAWPNTTKCTGFKYNDNNQRIETKFPNGVVSTVAWDTSQRMSSVTASGVTGVSSQPSWTWAYQSATGADAGLVSSMTDQAGTRFAYGYDKANRLNAAERKTSGGTVTWSATWAFDKNGNRTQQVLNGATTNYGYNAADQLCWYGTGTSSTCTTPSGATTLAYDSNGNQTSAITYTPFNQQATTGGTTNYSYAGTTNNQRLSYAGTPYTPSLISNQTTQHGTSSPTKIIREPSGGLIAYQTGGDSYYYITDRQSSVVLITGGPSNSPALAADYDYSPYGATISATGSQATFNKYRYTGAFIDITSTGLYKMGARYYNQDTGRFTQPDPSGQEFNRYNYAVSNPATYNDPSGLGVDFWVGAAAVIVGGLVGVATGGLALGAVGLAEAAVFGGTIGLATTDAVVNGVQDYQDDGEVDVLQNVGEYVSGLGG